MSPKGHSIQALFVGLGASRIAWYRIVLPAMFLGCDWVGVTGTPPKLRFASGYVKQATQMPRFEDYDVVVIQQPHGRAWFNLIAKLQSKGIPVLYEIDDYVHAIRKAVDHDFKHEYSRDTVKAMELCMRKADGMIVSTEYLRQRYRSFNERVWVCPNGLDMARYRLSRPATRPEIGGERSVTIMWSGATAHTNAITPWLEMIAGLMGRYRQVRFASIGYPFADMIDCPGRCLSIPFAFLETYPAAMTIGDIALAPAGKSNFYRAKSPLRALEAGALGIPVIADAGLYGGVVLDGVTGYLADSREQAARALEALIEDESLRVQLGDAARAHVQERYDMRVQVEHWKAAIVGALT